MREVFILFLQEDSQKIKSLEKDLKEARAKPSGGGGAEDVSNWLFSSQETISLLPYKISQNVENAVVSEICEFF